MFLFDNVDAPTKGGCRQQCALLYVHNKHVLTWLSLTWFHFFLGQIFSHLNKLRKKEKIALWICNLSFFAKRICSPSPHLLGISLKSHFRVQSVKVQFGPTIWKRKLFFHCNYPSRIFLPLLIALGRLLLLRLLTYFTLLLEKLILVLAPLRVSLWVSKKNRVSSKIRYLAIKNMINAKMAKSNFG